MSTHTSNLGQSMRMLTADELNAVSGGFINDNSCIRPQTIIPNLPQEPKGFVDVFAKYRIG